MFRVPSSLFCLDLENPTQFTPLDFNHHHRRFHRTRRRGDSCLDGAGSSGGCRAVGGAASARCVVAGSAMGLGSFGGRRTRGTAAASVEGHDPRRMDFHLG